MNGLCECGCGNPAPISKINNHRYGWVKGQAKRFIRGHYKRYENNPNWKHGKFISTDGYIMARRYIHGDTYKDRREHTIIAEQALGKALPPGTKIHHYNGKLDNKSIVICQDQAYHTLLETRTRALKECGHAGWRKCPYCKQWDDVKNLYIGGKRHHCHRACSRQYRIELKRLKASSGLEVGSLPIVRRKSRQYGPDIPEVELMSLSRRELMNKYGISSACIRKRRNNLRAQKRGDCL